MGDTPTLDSSKIKILYISLSDSGITDLFKP